MKTYLFCIPEALIARMRILVGILITSFATLSFMCGFGLKDDGMTDEDYIKINVRWGYLSMTRAWERTVPGRVDPNNMKEMLEYSVKAYIDLLEKYGYSDKAMERKKNEVHADRSKFWILNSIESLRGVALNFFGNPLLNRAPSKLDTDDDWDKFFIDNEKHLHPPM